ncbi:MAG: hypothetical protein CEE43_00110 [Promethearchaeota archaeon Loki_b32]|nr:MAG: hypothetical protein CEE43_00110 [Candidatus Lokiarchaeota archaeon Loki_b32]
MAEIKAIDPVKINNQFAVFSTYSDDPIFNNEIISIDSPIFCAGKITNFEQNVYNFNKNDLVAYISLKQNLNIEISSNLILKFNNNGNQKLIAFIPYASFAMKILREIDPKIAQNISIIGKNFFSTLLANIIRSSGANVINIEKNNDINYNDEDSIDSLIVVSNLTQKNRKLIETLNIKKKYYLKQISIFDKGLDDPKYIKGIKYPYSYVRWKFKENLNFFLYLVEKNVVNIDFLELTYVKAESIEDLKNKVKDAQKNSLILYEISY